MARTAVTPTAASPNSSVAQPAGTTIDATLVTNGVKISGIPLEELILEITNTYAGTKTATIQASDGTPPALEGGVGDLTVSFAQDAVKVLGPFTSGRFLSTGGQLWVDFQSGFTGTIRAYRIPRTA